MTDVCSRSRRPVLFLGVYLAVLAGAYENIGLSAVFPNVAHHLGNSGDVAVFITAFTSGSFISTVLAGRRVRHGNFVSLFLFFTAVQLAGLVTCATATGNGAFVLGRVLQGLGEGAITVLAFFALTQFASTRAGRARALAGISVAWLVASVISPLFMLGLPSAGAWRLILVILMVLSVVSAVCVVLGRDAARSTGGVAKGEDLPGGTRSMVLLVGAAVLIGAFSLSAQSIPSRPLAVVTGSAVLVLLTWLLWSGRLGLGTGYSMPVLGGMAVRGAVSSLYFAAINFVPLVLIVARGQDDTAAAVCVALAAIGWTAGAYYQSAARPAPPARQLSGSMALVSSGVLGVGIVLVSGAPWSLLVAPLFVAGSGAGIANNVLPAFLTDLVCHSRAAATLSAMEAVDAIWSTLTIALIGLFIIPAVSTPIWESTVTVVYVLIAAAALAASLLIGTLGREQTRSVVL